MVTQSLKELLSRRTAENDDRLLEYGQMVVTCHSVVLKSFGICPTI